MGDHLIGRPIGPSFVPGTLKGQSSPFSSVPNAAPSAENNLQAQATAPAAAPGMQPLPPGITSAVPVNPSQTPRTKFSAPTPGSPISHIKLAGQALRMPSAIGTANTGFRRLST